MEKPRGNWKPLGEFTNDGLLPARAGRAARALWAAGAEKTE